MFRNANNTTISGGIFTVVNEEVYGRQILSQSPYVIHGAIHDSGQRYPPSECHPGTREDILKIALDWVDTPLDESESQVFWLSGPAGVGKTAIAQSLCQRLKELGRLGGDFFLSRSVAGHSDLHTLFPTLAYQLAGAYPDFGYYLDNVINSDASVLTKNMGIQLDQLIIKPLKRAHNDSSIPLVLVVDGLDEAGLERDQTLLLWILESFVSHRLSLKIILTSRPEPWIRSAFGSNQNCSNPLADSTRCHFLHRTSQTDLDIRKVLQFGFESIQNKHHLMMSRSDRWPSSEVIAHLVDRASGQFIYASTLLRYVEDPNGNPVERLRRIIGMPSGGITDSPFLALDNLYKHVLSTSPNLQRTLTILGAVIASFRTVFIPSKASLQFNPDLGLSQQPVSPPQLDTDSKPPRAASTDYRGISEPVSFPIDRIERILNLRVADGLLALWTIQSLVDISSSMEVGIRFYHKSLQDFLLDRNRSGEYFLDISQVYSKLMSGCLRLLREFELYDLQSKPKTTYEDLRDMEVRWAEWWLCSAASDEARLLEEVKAIDKTAFYLNYAKKIIQKMIFLFSKSYPKYIGLLAERSRSSGNIAESILLEINGQKTFGLSLERFRSAQTFFEPRLSRAVISYLPGRGG